MVAGAILVIILLILVGLPLSLAHHTEFPLEGTLGHLAVNLVSSLNAGNVVNPLVKNDKTLADGGDLYNTNCSSCHGDHGDGKGKIVDGYYPPPADLTAANTQGKSDAQIRWIIKHGLSFTAMAAYSDFDDQQLWSIVIFIRSLKK
jgi:mono/diheme cytochrome c family protein